MTMRALPWVGVMAALAVFAFQLTTTDPATAVTAITILALGLIAAFAIFAALLRRGLQRVARGDLDAIESGVVRRYCEVQDRHWAHVIEAHSDSLGGALRVIYPFAARVSGLEGHAQARFELADDGSVRNVEIVEATHPIFAQSLQESLSRVQGAPPGPPPQEPRQIRIHFAIERA